MEYGIEEIRELATQNRIKWNGHAVQRMLQRSISRKQILDGLMCGEIIEEYPEDYPYPSCLILGMLTESFPLHVICSVGQGYLWIITVYKPDEYKWCSEFKTRKDVK